MVLRVALRWLSRGGLRALVLAMLSVWLCSAPLAAQEPERGQVALRASELSRKDPEFQETLRELLSRVGLELVTPTRAHDERVLWRVDVELVGSAAAITLHNQRSDTRVRRHVKPAETDALFRETVAHVILAVIEPMAAEAAVSPEPAEPAAEPRSEPEPAAPEPAHSEASALLSAPRVDAGSEAAKKTRGEPGLLLNVRGGPLLLGSSELAGQVGGGLALRFMTRLSPSLALEALGIVPAHVEQAGLEARVGLVSLRVLPGLELVERPRGTLGMMLAPGVDLISFRSARAPREVAPQPKSSRVQPVAGLRLRGSLRVSSFMALLLGAGLDVDFAPRRWVLTGPGGSQEVFETSRYRPYAFLGADLTLFRGRRSKP